MQFWPHRKTQISDQTRKLSYRKDDHAMRPIYGCSDSVCESLTTSTATFPEILMGFCSHWSHECAYKIWCL